MDFLRSPEKIRTFLLNLGTFGYLLYFIILILSVPLPIPSAALIVIGGYVYGIFGGTIIAFIGVIIGHLLAFFLARKFGKPFIEKMVDQHHIQQFNHLLTKRGKPFAFISYAIPIFPSDCVSLLLGFTNISFSIFSFILIAGIIPRFFLLTMFGNDLFKGINIYFIIIITLVCLFGLIAVFREKIKYLFFKELHTLEQEAIDMERYVGLKKKIKKKRKPKIPFKD